MDISLKAGVQMDLVLLCLATTAVIWPTGRVKKKKFIRNATSQQHRAAVAWVYQTSSHLGKDGEDTAGTEQPQQEGEDLGRRRMGIGRGASKAGTSNEW